MYHIFEYIDLTGEYKKYYFSDKKLALPISKAQFDNKLKLNTERT